MSTTLTNDICLEVILADARRWYKRDFPRDFVRGKDTDKHMRAALKRELDHLFLLQNMDWDNALMRWYERMVERYGGDASALPWDEYR